MTDEEPKIFRRWPNLSRRGFLGAALTAVPAVGLFGKNAVVSQKGPSSASGQTRIKEYRTLGRTGFKVSDVSFGGGGLNNANVLAAALDAGMNYIDTAEHYANGNSERAAGDALKARDRKSVFLTTKLNLTFFKGVDKEGIRNRFGKCLERLKTDYADCLMIHMCTLAQVKYEPYHELIKELKAEGKVRFSGLSNHGADYSLNGPLTDSCEDVVIAAAEDGRFDVVLCTYNFLKGAPSEKMFAACKASNMGVTLMKMNPALTTSDERQMIAEMKERYAKDKREIPESQQKLFKITEERGAAVDEFLTKHGLAGPEQVRAAAIKYCLSRPEVHAVCPSINSFEELDAYVALSGGRFEAYEKAMLADCRAVYGDLTCRIGCGACEPACPRGVPVATVMRYKYYFRTLRQEKLAMAEYAALGDRGAAECAGCDAPCEKACPHGLPVGGLMALSHETLTLV
jgi:hypothetical protein